MTERAAILVVEDDAPTRTFLADNLTADGYELLVAACSRDGAAHARAAPGRPRRRRRRAARRLRARAAPAGPRRRRPGSRVDPRLPLLVVSGRAGESDRVRSFERGADDFVAKPFAYGELRLRIAAVLRRARERRRGGPPAGRRAGARPARARGALRGARVGLSAKEFALLRALATEPTRVFTKAELLRDVWGFRALGATRTWTAMRAGCGRSSRRHGDRYVINVWGVGYRLLDGDVDEEAAAATAAALGERRDAHCAPCGRWTAAARAAADRRSPSRLAWRSRSRSPRLARVAGAASRSSPRRRTSSAAPLGAALLGLHGVARPRGRAAVAAVELELRRAALALEDLEAARRGRRGRPAGAVDLGALLAGAVEGLAPARARPRPPSCCSTPARGALPRPRRPAPARPGRRATSWRNALEHGAARSGCGST